MPTYEFVCESCNNTQTIVQSIHAQAPEDIKCDCGATALRKFTPTPVTFNAVGFYKTDNRKNFN